MRPFYVISHKKASPVAKIRNRMKDLLSPRKGYIVKSWLNVLLARMSPYGYHGLITRIKPKTANANRPNSSNIRRFSLSNRCWYPSPDPT